MSHVINSRALTGEKPCINKAIHALLMHGYATFNMLIPGHRIAAITRCVLPCPRTSIVRGNSVRATSVKRRNKIVQECFQFLCNNSDRIWFFNALTFVRSSALVFNISHGAWRLLMHEKPCLIPIFTRCVLPCPKISIVRGNSVRATSVTLYSNIKDTFQQYFLSTLK